MKIYELNKIDEKRLGDVGGKAKGLYLLDKLGLNIAPGFVAVDINDELGLQAAADYYENSGMEIVAVRSSATAEDGKDFSSAGLYNSFLNVAGKSAVKKSIMSCIASLESETANSYSSFFSAAKSHKMCVIVQKMINAEISGVCFSDHPGDEKRILVEATGGLGDKLVSGQAAAHSYCVPKDTMKIDGDELLDSRMIEAIARQAVEASGKLGYPLDTEWAIEGGRLYWLQARPITASNGTDAFELDTKVIPDDNILTTCNVGEMLPGAVTPLSLSTSVASIDFGIRKMVLKAGAAKSYDEIPEGCGISSVGNHLFINISTASRIGDYVIGGTRQGVELSICNRILDDIPKPPVPKVSKILRLNNARKYFTILFGVKIACRKIKRLAQNLQIPKCETAEAAIKEISKKLCVIDEAFWLHYISSAHSGSMNSALFLIMLEQGQSIDDAKTKIAGVLEDIDGIESVDILRSLKTAARALMKENKDIAAYSADELAKYIKICGKEAKTALDDFYERHGHRSIREAELRSKSWHMDDISLCSYLKSIIAAGAKETRQTGQAKENIEKLLLGQKGIMRFVINFIIKQARKGVVNREFTKSMSIKVLDKFKTAYRELADVLADSGVLPDSDLIFFLTHQELKRLINNDEAALIKKAVARRRILEEQKKLKFEQVSLGKPKPIEADIPAIYKKAVMTGSSISRGKATGKARVVKSVEEANMLEEGEIMVAAFTDIGWSPYYCMINALVTEVGSALSHGAVVAREYSLPLVANIPYATQVIKTGDMLSVDAYTGEVAII